MQKELQPNRLETKFKDFKPALNATEADAEANRCINCYEAPCINACPTRINIPRFISRIASGDVTGSAKTILDSNILGLSCAQSCPTEVLCEGACVYHSLNKKPIQIGKLQRYAVEDAYKKGIHFYQPGPATGKKVALIGAGPASLACAHELRKAGHAAVIFEKAQLPGGLNTHGIAPYKMRAETSLREIEEVERMGVEFRYGQSIGVQVSFEKLLSEFDLVFLGMGLGPDSKLSCPGADLPEVHGAVDFIAKMKTLPASELKTLREAKCAVVVGGGNTALDACRELKGLGVSKVIVSYRRGADEMSGYVHEMNAARVEGVEFWFHTLPVEISKANSALNVTLQKTTIDAQGQVRASGEKLTLQADLVLVAAGQSKLDRELSRVAGLQFEKGRLVANEKTGQTGNKKIFAGGDLVNGGMEVVNAVAEGKRAAIAMCEVLKNG